MNKESYHSEETISTTNASGTVKTSEIKVPESYLVVLALIVLIILSPQLKIGLVEVELQTAESVEIDTTLRPAQEAFVSEGDILLQA
jgi:hypothetical protein